MKSFGIEGKGAIRGGGVCVCERGVVVDVTAKNKFKSDILLYLICQMCGIGVTCASSSLIVCDRRGFCK